MKHENNISCVARFDKRLRESQDLAAIMTSPGVRSIGHSRAGQVPAAAAAAAAADDVDVRRQNFNVPTVFRVVVRSRLKGLC